MDALTIHDGAVEEIAARLDLREPNVNAIKTLDLELSQHFDVEGRTDPLEIVFDMATGVGKTFVMAGAIELMAQAYAVRDFVIITPGNTILRKTKDNFTAGHRKSLLPVMSMTPLVVTAENFNTPAIRSAMDDPDQVKIYIFTVQSITSPTSKVGKRTHKFQEGLGTGLYEHLQKTDRLAVLADEHHAYFGKGLTPAAFSSALRDLAPWLLLGLTATPIDPKRSGIRTAYCYPVAAAIAQRYVKTPMIVGRKDDRSDSFTKLSDGALLLEAKAAAVTRYVDANPDARPVNPVMLVVAANIAEADEYGDILRSEEFFGGAYKDAVLVVHSTAPDEALEALDQVEAPESPVRMIISVGMLKEGWDVRNVYVIASMRASVSEILTEQTLGRGMRLPFGRYTDIEFLDTVEVIAHERYSDLLKKANVLNEAFVDYRTRTVVKRDATGNQVAVSESVNAGPIEVFPVYEAAAPPSPSPTRPVAPSEPRPQLGSVEDRQASTSAAVDKMRQEIAPRTDAPGLVIPILSMTTVESKFSLNDITDLDEFFKLGRSLASDPESELARTKVSAEVVTGRDGIPTTRLVTSAAVDRITGTTTLFGLDELRTQLAQAVMASAAVSPRRSERTALDPILDRFFEGLGDRGVEVLSANLGRSAARLIRTIEVEQRRFAAAPAYSEVVELHRFSKTRVTDRDVTSDRHTTFSTRLAYEGWSKSIMPLVWFDSRPERSVANIVDDDAAVAWWLRLHNGDLPILWSTGRDYNPDLIVIESDKTHWLVEVKSDREVRSEEVLAKRVAAKRWANWVSNDETVQVRWHYLLVSETDIDESKGSWSALKRLGN